MSRWLVAMLLCGLCSIGNAQSTVAVPPADNLKTDAFQVEQRKTPILLILTQTGCGYCELLMREVIGPMIVSGDYQDRILIRELSLDHGRTVIDFDGQTRPTADLASRYREWLTPTLLLLDGQGQELVERIRGINTLDYFSYYLDRAIEQARHRLTADS